MITIGVDARHLSEKNSGIKTYLVNLLHQLIKKTKDTHYWYVYCPYKLDKGLFAYENVKILDMPISTKVKGFHVVFSQAIIPIYAFFHKVDLIWFPANRAALFLPKKTARVLSIHDLVWIKHPETMKCLGFFLDKLFMVRSAKIADIVTTVSNSAFNEIIMAGISEVEKTVVVFNGGSVPAIIDNDDVYDDFFLFVGTLEPRKNLVRLLYAYKSLPLKCRQKFKLIVAGSEGWGKANLRDLISKLDLVEYVKVLGYVDCVTLSKLYKNAQFLVMPSLYEGFGLPLIEAMSYGTPVLTSNNSSMPEVSGKAGLLVDAFDVSSIAYGLQEMITNDERRSSLARNARRNASRYSWDISANKMIIVFEKALKLRNNKFL